MARQVVLCERCGAAGHEAVDCLAGNDRVKIWRDEVYAEVYAFKQRQASHTTAIVPPHPLYQRGYEQPPFVWPPHQQAPPPDKQKEEIAELKSLIKALALQVQEGDRHTCARFDKLKSQIAQLAVSDDWDDSDYEVLSDNEALHEDFSTVQQESLDRATYISRSSEIPEESFNRALYSTRSNSCLEAVLDRAVSHAVSSDYQEESSRSSNISTRSTDLARESKDLSLEFVLNDNFDNDNGYGESPFSKPSWMRLRLRFTGRIPQRRVMRR